MKIFFDNIIFSLQKSGGISVVWFELLSRITKEKKFNTLFIEHKNAAKNIFRNKLKLPQDQIILKLSLFDKLTRYSNLSLTNEKAPFIFHSSYYRISSNPYALNITTVHDFIYEKYGSGLSKKIHCIQKHNAIRKADKLICISENTKKDLIELFPKIDESKISVIYNGVSDEYFTGAKCNGTDLPFEKGTYIIFIGNRQTYKRFDIAIDVSAKLSLNLLIIGGGELSKKELLELNNKLGSTKYKFINKINNSGLNILYNNALCLLYPSMYEGFGLPVLEAQKAGCPVVAFNGSSISEIAGNSATLFNKHSVIEISNLISKISDDEIFREHIIQEGLVNSSKFSWDNNYKQIINLYSNLY